jgi:putative chitinase
MTPQQLALALECPLERAALWLMPLTVAEDEFLIDTPRRQAAFLAQIGHESTGLAHLEENLNYSAQRMMAVWPKRFPTIESARYYEHSPERLANFVYANRNGNGGYVSGDGWRYRGRGPIQTTGLHNYALLRDALGLDVVTAPEMLLAPVAGARSAANYFARHGCNSLADVGDIDGISRIVNGGTQGIDDRRRRYVAALQILTTGSVNGPDEVQA